MKILSDPSYSPTPTFTNYAQSQHGDAYENRIFNTVGNQSSTLYIFLSEPHPEQKFLKSGLGFQDRIRS